MKKIPKCRTCPTHPTLFYHGLPAPMIWKCPVCDRWRGEDGYDPVPAKKYLAGTAGYSHIVALKTDGTVVAAGPNRDNRCDVGSWKNIKQVTAGHFHTVGLKKDGTVVATGCDGDNQCSGTGLWTDIIQVAAAGRYTMGLRNNGLVVITGMAPGMVHTWRDVTKIWALKDIVLALDTDGKFLADGNIISLFKASVLLTSVVDFASGCEHISFLTKDGKVATSGKNLLQQCDTKNWSDIVSIAAGPYQTAGVKKDGTVVHTAPLTNSNYDTTSWRDIQQVAINNTNIIGLRKDGNVVVVGDNTCGQHTLGR